VALKDTALPAENSVGWYGHYASLDAEIRARAVSVWQIDSFTGATDDDKHVAAWDAARAAARKPVLQYPARTFGPLSTPVAAFSGMRAIGPDGNDGVKNQEISAGALVNHKVSVTTGSGASSLFVQSASISDVVFANISFTGSSTSQWWHNTNSATYNIYPAQFHSLSFDGFLNVLGNDANKFTCTQTVFSGHWTVLNYSGTPLHIGGSDNSLWMSGYLNSNSPASVAGAGKPILHLDWMEKTNVGYIYLTAENAWTGLRVTGPIARAVRFYGGVFEGRSSTNLATYPVIELLGGRTSFYGPDLGYVTTASGVITQSGGVTEIYSPHYRMGSGVAATYPLFYQTGGIAHISRPLNADGASSCRIHWKDAALGAQDQDVPYPAGNSLTTW
jgi:hypothetical protein